MVFAIGSDVGQLREENQDCCDAFRVGDAYFCVVADGMGGYKGGSIASRIAVDCVRRLVEEEYKETMSESSLLALLNSCFVLANSEILQRSIKDVELSGMGTTMVLAAVRKKRLLVLNIGDSRAYLIKDDGIEQITKDQSYVQHLVDLGEITEEEAKRHPQKNIIMQAVGVSTAVAPDVYPLAYPDGTLLLCSDGLSNMVEDGEIAQVVNSSAELPQKLEKLISLANEAGGRDNITAVLLQYNNGSAGDSK